VVAHVFETRSFPHGRAEILDIGNGEVGRLVFEPGSRWSNDVKLIAKTHSCEAPHFQRHVSGSLAIRMDDGTEIVACPGFCARRTGCAEPPQCPAECRPKRTARHEFLTHRH